MREYEVYHAWGTITIKADELRVYSILDKPVKIFFIKNDTIVAEFYVDNISGWAEKKRLAESEPKETIAWNRRAERKES